ncbi:S1C family serine protease [Candidatus Laterigemmans baculatus]|uniref:S1C family serine protease n=1 Tax=Candidatus Laterigemmans baculatus TaxID=2770505 RepID=UPI0013DB80A0|nr:trypsin-like peptidase domain-containing protein [Candidatus Laterigemmans baculatus]
MFRCWLPTLLLASAATILGLSGSARAADQAADAAVPSQVLAAEQERIQAIERAVPTAVSVFVPGGAGGGSGVLISPDGYALTNFHVSSPAGSYMRCGLSDGNVYDAVIVGIDPVGDLALIRLLGRDDFPAAELADSDQLQAGDWCFVVGNPFLLSTNLQPSVTWGMLSGVHRYQYPSGTLLEYADCLQTDAAINPGNSGGPLYDASGRLIGIVGRASFEKRGRVNVGVGYAISINQAKNFLGYLKSGRIVDHATLGATVATDPDGGVRVSNILESSDAYRRGLRYNDEIVEVHGRAVQTANDVQNILGTLPKGWRIRLAYLRGSERREILVRLAGVHGEDELIEKMAGALPPPPPAPPAPREGEDEAPGEPAPPEAEEPQEDGKEADAPKGADGKPIPEAALAQLEERAGFANYHFNDQHQQRLIEQLRRTVPEVSQRPTAWTIRGTTTGATPAPVVIQVSDNQLRMTVGDQEVVQDSVAARFEAVDQRSAAALLPALEAWRRLLDVGPRRFGDVFYLGTAPLLGELPLRDVLVGTAGELEARWMVHPESGAAEAVELTADRARDPAELLIHYASAEGEAPGTPARLELRYGSDVVLDLKIDSWTTDSEAGQS